MTYEEAIRARAERNGFAVEAEGQGLRVMAPSGRSCWHRLGGDSEQLFDQRLKDGTTGPGRWVATHAAVAPEWISSDKTQLF